MFFAQKKVQRFLLILALAITTAFGLSLRHSEVVAAQPAAQMLVHQPAQTNVQSEANAIRPFRINVPEAAPVDLRQRVVATRWPDQETVTDQSQGARLAKIQELVRYWGTGYDWRKTEAKLNALPQFVTNIDGLDIHFIHV